MKIDVIYEKKDVLRLISADIKAQGIQLKAGTVLEYKGALQVKLQVETDDDAIAIARPPVEVAAPPVPKPKTKRGVEGSIQAPDAPENQGADFSNLMNASKRISGGAPGPFATERVLGPNESHDFPYDPKG